MSFITLEQYAMGRDKLYPAEWLIAEPNAVDLLVRVNAFLIQIDWPRGIVVTSGFRPRAINKTVTGAAKSSFHQIGKAVDIADADHIFRNYFNPLENEKHAEILRLHGLFLEHPAYTATWLHFDCGDRADRPTRTFRPY